MRGESSAPGGEGVDGQGLGEVLEHPREQVVEVVVVAQVGERRLEVLRLAAVAVRGHDHAPGDRVGDLDAVLGAHQVQAQVDAGGRAGAGEDRAVLDVEHRRIDHDVRVARGEGVGEKPVRARAAPVEQTGRCQGERAAADREHPAAPGDAGPQRVDERGGRRAVERPGRDGDQVGGGEPPEPMLGADGEARRGAQRGCVDGDDREVVDRQPSVGPRRAEDLAEHAELERGDALAGHDGDVAQRAPRRRCVGAVPGGHPAILPGRIVTVNGIPATGGGASARAP